MDDRRLALLSLILAAAGIGALFVLTGILQPQTVTLAEIGDSDVGRIVTVSANLSRVSEKEGSLFMTLEESNRTLRAVYWESEARAQPEAFSLKAGGRVSVTGQVAVYRGELEIIIKKIGFQE